MLIFKVFVAIFGNIIIFACQTTYHLMTINSKEVIEIMLADDNNYARNFFGLQIEEFTDRNIRVVGSVSNGLELIRLVQRKSPDIVILDLAMPILDGYRTLKILNRKFPFIKVIIFSNYFSGYYISQMLIAGARAYLPKDSFIKELVLTIQEVYKEGYCFNNEILNHLLTSIIEDNELDELLTNSILSDREIEVLKHLCNEENIRTIAQKLYISENTVKHHRKNIYRKTNSKSIIALIKYAIKTGIATF